jgi:hypothetical protein
MRNTQDKNGSGATDQSDTVASLENNSGKDTPVAAAAA